MIRLKDLYECISKLPSDTYIPVQIAQLRELVRQRDVAIGMQQEEGMTREETRVEYDEDVLRGHPV
jgi:hypothetical protein